MSESIPFSVINTNLDNFIIGTNSAKFQNLQINVGEVSGEDLTINGTLNVSGGSALTGNVACQASLDVNGPATIGVGVSILGAGATSDGDSRVLLELKNGNDPQVMLLPRGNVSAISTAPLLTAPLGSLMFVNDYPDVNGSLCIKLGNAWYQINTSLIN